MSHTTELILVLCALAWVIWKVYRTYWDHQLQLKSSRELVGRRFEDCVVVGVDEQTPYWVICRFDDGGEYYFEAHKVRRDLAMAGLKR